MGLEVTFLVRTDVDCCAQPALKIPRRGRHRLADILHVATAVHLGGAQFLTFDANQKKLAEAEGMVVPL